MWLIVILLLLGLLLFLYFKFFKLLKLKSIVFIDGSLGTGKSFMSVAVAVRVWKRNVRRYYVRLWLTKALSFIPKMKDANERIAREGKPLLYSNIKLRNVEFVRLTKDLMTRNNKRFVKGSVLLIDEFSLMADQMMYKDDKLNEQLTIFFKLFRHEVGAGCLCVINSQSTSDLHYSLKYVLSDYVYIHSRAKFPFFTALRGQELVYCADKNGQNIMNVNQGDIEDNGLKLMLFSNKYYKYYDSYCYSIFSDDFEIVRDTLRYEKGDSLKSDDLVSFREYRYLKKKEGAKNG